MTRNSSTKHNSSKVNFWQSYTDMMSALLLTFILLLLAALLVMQKSYDEKEKIILEQQEQINEILGTKSELIAMLTEEFSHSEFALEVDPQTGAIKLPSGLLFETNKYELRPEGIAYLDAFIPKYMSILLNGKVPELAEIIIEGHTDTDGSYLYNLDLSQNRALSVAKYCLDEKNNLLTPEQLQALRTLLTANGKSKSMPVLNADGSVNKQASRRVEIKFRLKDEEMVQQINEIFTQMNGN